MKKLTQAIIDEALPKEKEFYLFDDQIKGLGCRILPSNQKTYYFRYTSPVDKTRKKIKLGDVKVLNLEDARNIARKYAIEIYNQTDPLIKIKEQIEEQKKSITFKEFWVRFEKEYIQEKQKQSTIKSNDCNFRRILDFFGNMELNKIEYSDIIKFKNTIDFKSVFSISLSYLRTAFNHAEICNLRSQHSNPCFHVKGVSSKKRVRYLSDIELSNLTQHLEYQIKNGRRSSHLYFALLCLIYTGQRKNEIVQLKWEDVDLDKKIAQLHDSKTGKRVIILNDEALFILNRVPRIQNNPYIFCSTNSNSYIKNIDSTWDIIRANLNLNDVRIHDLRHTFASVAINNGIDRYELSQLLGHSNFNSTERYAHLYTKTLLKTSNKIFKNQTIKFEK